MPNPKNYILKQSEVDAMRLISPNKVLIEIVEKNTERTTASGLIMVSPTYRSIARPSGAPVHETDWLLSQNAQRTGVIRQVPKSIKHERNHLWGTTVEVQEGDSVWFDYMMAENCDIINTEERLYYIMDYFDLHLVKRGDKVIMLNGYCLFSPVDVKIDSPLFVDFGKKDARYGIATHLGSINKYYHGGLVDDPNIQEGYKCIFKLPPVMLEDSYLAAFDGKNQYRISQRHNILAYIDENERLCATSGHAVIVPEYNTHIGSIEIPESLRKPSGIGRVHDPGTSDLQWLQTVQYLPGAGITIEHHAIKFLLVEERHILVTFNN